MNTSELYKAGKLAEALAAAADEVQKQPTDTGRRSFYTELLLLAGQWQRADKQAEILAQQDLQLAVPMSVFRQLLRAEEARQQFFASGRLPEFLAPPSETLTLHLEASIHLRERKPAEAAQLLARAAAAGPSIAGTCDGQPFEGFRDLDDLLAPLVEVLTSTGKYYWVPVERLELVEFHPPERVTDLVWRRAHLIVRGGPDGEVYLPVLYPGAAEESDDQLRLGRATQWRGGDDAPVRGAGQRVYLVGDADRSILDLRQLQFNAAEDETVGSQHGQAAS